MASLTGTKIKDSYDGLLKTTDNGALGASAKLITDGLGNSSGVYLGTSGDVGIGVSPNTKLHTSDTDTTAYSASSVGGQDTLGTIKIQNLSTNANTFAAIDFNTNNNRVVNRIVSSHGSSTSNGFLAFITEGSGVPAERMRIDSSGNVGIGCDPDYNLEIADSSQTPAILLGTPPYTTNGTFLIKQNILTSHTNYNDVSTVSVGASRYTVGNGTHHWYTSPSTEAGFSRTFTERMRIRS